MKLLKSIFLSMGNVKSKSKIKEGRDGNNKTEQQEMKDRNSNNFSSELGAAYDPELIRMKRCLEKDEQAFILNNLMLCVQFFENYEQ